MAFNLYSQVLKIYDASSRQTSQLGTISNFRCGISGVAIGSGWQAVVAYVNLTCYYIIGLPIGCVLGFKTSMGVAVST